MFTTIDTLIDDQIEILMINAGRAGDLVQCAICTYAMGSDSPGAEFLDSLSDKQRARVALFSTTIRARAECARVIAAAEVEMDAYDNRND